MKTVISFAIAFIVTGSFVACKKSVLDQKLPDFLKRFAPEEQVFRIDPARKNSVKTEKGARFIIPQNTFELSEKLLPGHTIDVKVTEAYTSFELATSGVALRYTMPDGSTAWFESAGMFSFTAYYKGEKLAFAKGKRVRVKFPNVQPGKKFNVYYVKNGQWVYHGHNQETRSASSRPLTAKEKRLMKAYERGYKLKLLAGTRLYEIDNPGRYNFDYPSKKTACATGRFINKNKTEGYSIYYITALGIDHRGFFSSWSDKPQFRMSLFSNKTYTFIVMDNLGNIGVSKTITIWGKMGLAKYRKLPCMNIGTITLRKANEEILKDKQKFMRFIGIKAERYIQRPKARSGR